MIKDRITLSLTFTLMIAVIIFTFSGCGDVNSPNLDENMSSIETATMNGAMQKAGKVVHKASVGGADVCEAIGLPTGCDANFSLTAIQYEDGSVKGQYQDVTKNADGSAQPLHIKVDCMIVDGNSAVVGGVLTKGRDSGPYSAGNRVATKVVDNGTSSNDVLDQISFSFASSNPDFTCSNLANASFPLFDLEKGQVKVK